MNSAKLTRFRFSVTLVEFVSTVKRYHTGGSVPVGVSGWDPNMTEFTEKSRAEPNRTSLSAADTPTHIRTKESEMTELTRTFLLQNHGENEASVRQPGESNREKRALLLRFVVTHQRHRAERRSNYRNRPPGFRRSLELCSVNPLSSRVSVLGFNGTFQPVPG